MVLAEAMPEDGGMDAQSQQNSPWFPDLTYS
jgi:hypothetical protein